MNGDAMNSGELPPRNGPFAAGDDMESEPHGDSVRELDEDMVRELDENTVRELDEDTAREPSESDLPGMPSAAEAWDDRSGEWLAVASAGAGVGAGTWAWAKGSASVSAGVSPSFAEAAEGSAGASRAASASASALALASASGRSEGGDADGGRSRRTVPRRGVADPVKALLHRHRELCERAVDPLEIAAGLEAHGVTDRTAARFRHRDVFSLAEELYARVPRDGEPRPQAESEPGPRVRADWVLLTLLPGVLGTVTVTGLRLTHGQARLLVALGGLLAVALAVRTALRHGPLAGRPGTAPRSAETGTRAWTLWLLGYALLGDGLLGAIVSAGPDALPDGAPDGPWPMTTAPALALALACAPAAWCAHLLAVGARRRLAGSRGLEDFSAAARPLLLGTFALFLGALTALLALCAAALHEDAGYAQALTLGALLLIARLLVVHHHRHAPALVLGAAGTIELVAPALLLAGRLPGFAFLAAPVQALVDTWGVAVVPALACGTAALTLLVHALRTLTRASAHAPTGAPE